MFQVREKNETVSKKAFHGRPPGFCWLGLEEDYTRIDKILSIISLLLFGTKRLVTHKARVKHRYKTAEEAVELQCSVMHDAARASNLPSVGLVLTA